MTMGGHSKEIDIWSVGVLTFMLLTGQFPFDSNDRIIIQKKIKSCSFQFPGDQAISEEARNFIKKILVLKPEERLTFKQMLEDPFFSQEKQNLPNQLPLQTLRYPPNQKFLTQQANYLESFNQQQDIMIDDYQQLNESSPQDGELSKTNSVIKKEMNSDVNSPIIRQKSLFDQSLIKFSKLSTQIYQNNNQIYISEYVNFTQKFGFGYLLTNNQIGILFNDYSKIIYQYNSEYLLHIDFDLKQTNSQEILPLQQNEPEARPHLQKKIQYLKNFIKYFQDKKNLNQQNNNNSQTPIHFQSHNSLKENEGNYYNREFVTQKSKFSQINLQQQQQLNKEDPLQTYNILTTIYLKNFIEVKNGIFFKFNNRLIQVNFHDSTQLFFYRNEKIIIFINQFNKSVEFDLKNKDTIDPDENKEIYEKLVYAKKIIKSLLSNKNQPLNSTYPYV